MRIHRHPGLTRTEVRTERAISVTSPARTILDDPATATDRELAYALDQAEIQELTDYPALDAIARAHPRHRGATRLRRTLEEQLPGTAKTRSGLEIAFLELCARRGFPTPLVNEPLCGMTVDFVFAEQRVAVETDSWRWHRGRRPSSEIASATPSSPRPGGARCASPIARSSGRKSVVRALPMALRTRAA